MLEREARECHVLLEEVGGREIAREGVVLMYIADSRKRAAVVGRRAEPLNCARCRATQSEQDLNKSRFPCSIGPEKPIYLTGRDRQRNVGNGSATAEPEGARLVILRDVLKDSGGGHRRNFSTPGQVSERTDGEKIARFR